MSVGVSEPQTAQAPQRAASSAAPVTIVPVLDRATWDALLARAAFPHLPQTYGYGEGKRATGWSVERVALQRGGRSLAIATALAGDARISRVIYPGLASHPQAVLAASQMESGGTLVTFEIKGGKEAAFKFMNALEIIKISNNLGDAKSIATHPATTTHQRLPQDQKDLLGITPGLIRLSVGLEDEADLIDELRAALAVI